MQRSLIRKLKLYEFELDDKLQKQQQQKKNNCWAKDESAINHRTVTKCLKNFFSGSKNREMIRQDQADLRLRITKSWSKL